MYSIEQFSVPRKEEIHKPEGLIMYGLEGRSRVGKGSVVAAIKKFDEGKVYVPSTSFEIKAWLKSHPTNPNESPSSKELYHAGCEMQALYGEDVFVRKFTMNAIELYNRKEIVYCAIDALRRAEEARTAKYLGIIGIWVEANLQNRWNRIQENPRPEDPKTIEMLAELDREQEFELCQVRQLAKFRIVNDGSPQDLEKEVFRKLYYSKHTI